ncbi:MAG: NUDIX domain-containing protein [Patescibacteria group bacterium]
MQIIDKLAWLYVKDRKVLFVRSRGKDIFYTVGGKREAGESDEQALIREVREEVGVAVLPQTIKYLNTFTDKAHGKEGEILVKLTCYAADFTGAIAPASEIEELAWLDSRRVEKTSPTGTLVIHWLKEKGLID